MRLLPLLLAAALLAALLAVPAAAGAASAPDEGAVFEPAPSSTAIYATKAETHQHVLKAADGTDLYIETWLPEAKDGRTPPARVPTVLVMTPYVQPGVQRYTTRNLAPLVDYFTQRGYAVAQHHVRGTGASGGCLEQTADKQIDDAARVIEWLGKDAPWADGAVGMYGISYDAETQISVAGRGDPAKTRYLKAIIPSETVGGQYEYSFMDGVPYTGQALLSNSTYFALTSVTPDTPPQYLPGRAECQAEVLGSSADVNGDMTPYWKTREYRPQIPNFRAATLWLHGFADWNVQPITMSASFDRIPDAVPHKALFGVFDHNYPDKHAGVAADWERPDWLPMALAWFDRYLKGADSGVESWPAAQVQDSSGQWRAAPGFPRHGGPAGQLALGAGGKLGESAPTGSDAFNESNADESVVYETPAVSAPLTISGEAIADLWLTTSMPDGHITGVLQVLGADGAVATFEGGQEIGTHGARSLQHLDPMPDGFFAQEAGQAPPTGEPIRVPLRFQPADLVVPAGGKLRLTISGQTAWARQTTPSGFQSTITLLHDCEHPSALRFMTQPSDAPLLNVRETDEEGALRASAPAKRMTDGGGLASGKVCGQDPERLPSFGSEAASYAWPPKTSEFLPRPPACPPRATASRTATASTTCLYPRLTVRISRARLRTALRKGLRVRLAGCGRCGGVKVTAFLSRATARKRRVSTRIATRPARNGAATLRFSKRVRSRLSRAKSLRVTVVAQGAAEYGRASITLRR